MAHNHGYLGNPNLKPRNQNVDWTPELLSEYIKCSNDPVYFVETYMKIIQVDKGLINFKLYDYQHEMMRSFQHERNTVVVSARQSGKSVTVCAFILWYILFNEDKVVALLANKGETAREILGRVQLAYQHLPKWLQQGVVEWNKGSFVLENNSRVLASATSTQGIRGFTINLLFIDEAAFIDTWEEFFTSVYPTISSGTETKVILVSTPNGLNHFHAIWLNAVKGYNGYRPIMVKWEQVPGRGAQWKTDTLAAMNFDEEKFNQEYCCEFLGSSGTLIAGWKLKELSENWVNPIKVKDGLSQYEAPEPDHKYAIVADSSRGKGLDYSAFQCYDITEMPYRQACVFRSNIITPGDYASVIHRTAMSYNNAIVLIEVNDIGDQVAQALHLDLAYENILFTENSGRAGKKVTNGFGGTRGQVDKGIKTTKTVKTVGCSLLKLILEQGQMTVIDHETVNELTTFSKKTQQYEAEPGKHDDLVTGLVLFAWLSDQIYFKEYTDINTIQMVRDKSEEQITEDLCELELFVEDGQEKVDSKGWREVEWVPIPQFDVGIGSRPPTFMISSDEPDLGNWDNEEFKFPDWPPRFPF